MRKKEMRNSIRLAEDKEITTYSKVEEYKRKNPQKKAFVISYRGNRVMSSENMEIGEIINSLKEYAGEI